MAKTVASKHQVIVFTIESI